MQCKNALCMINNWLIFFKIFRREYQRFLAAFSMVMLSSPAMNYVFDKNHIRYLLASTYGDKPYQWLFLPGGPGADSSYLQGLIQLLHLPGNCWLVDLPGNGSNIESVPFDYDFDKWFDLFLPMVKKFENPIIVGHSFGGMLPLLYPELENYLKGFVIMNSAPTLWLEEAVRYSKKFNLPDLTNEMQEFTKNPNAKTFQVALDACMPYYFPESTLNVGRELLSKLPFNFPAAVWWQRKAVELNFTAKWIPEKVKTLILSGTYDCIVPFSLFKNDERFHRSNIEMINIEKGGHCGWLEDPEAMKAAFENYAQSVCV